MDYLYLRAREPCSRRSAKLIEAIVVVSIVERLASLAASPQLVQTWGNFCGEGTG
jgi:hypothetical protein